MEFAGAENVGHEAKSKFRRLKLGFRIDRSKNTAMQA